MKRSESLRAILTPLIEIGVITWAFLASYSLRGITDGIPFVQMRIPYIPFADYLPFIWTWLIFWLIVFAIRWLYQLRGDTPLIEEIRSVIVGVCIWFLAYITFVYFSIGLVFEREIPRLIIIYVTILSGTGVVIVRSLRSLIYDILYRQGILEKNTIAIIRWSDDPLLGDPSVGNIYQVFDISDLSGLRDLIRMRQIDSVISMISTLENRDIREIYELTQIYGISFGYPKVLPGIDVSITRRDRFVGRIPIVEISSISISIWERIIKRSVDILLSIIGLIILSPVYILIAIGILIEDFSGPVIFRNRRVGLGGSEFFLYKFRYMYWKYSVKDAYGVKDTDDEALKYENTLRQESDSRDGPLYKIRNDPRRMVWWRLIERLSLDELPQLWNVLKGDMSLVGPRPHQPREVELYRETDHQLLTIRPGITGMAQVYGRDHNTFDEEVTLDRYYIEHYSILLDIVILGRTLFVVMARIWQK
jgi:lipopolysaccharide/colanic/teichoic acid biosynthesis glycosyltransferase